ncbi:MAG: hypothetical protein ACEPOZ_03105 [Marinifilaceae bacterium]
MKKFVFGLLFVFAFSISSFASTQTTIALEDNTVIVKVDQDQKKCPANCTCEKCVKAKKAKAIKKECCKKSAKCTKAKKTCCKKKEVKKTDAKKTKCDANCTKPCCKKS